MNYFMSYPPRMPEVPTLSTLVIGNHVSALLQETSLTSVESTTPSIFKRFAKLISTTALSVVLIGCGGNPQDKATQNSVEPQIKNTTTSIPTLSTNNSVDPFDMYGCIGTIRTLSLNNPDTGDLITRMPDHATVRIDGDATPDQDTLLDNNAKAKEQNPNADYNWKLITFVDPLTGEIYNGAAAEAYIDPRNPVTGGCEHLPGQNVHEGYGDYYKDK